jgi:hypothetical protein
MKIKHLLIALLLATFTIAQADELKELRKFQAEADEMHRKFVSETKETEPEDPSVWVTKGEEGYVNCLLTTLAEGKRNSIEMDMDGQFVDLVQLAEGNKPLQEWTKKLSFDYGSLSMRKTLIILESMIGLRTSNTGIMKSIVLQIDGTPLAVFFKGRLTNNNRGIKIRVLRPY